MTEPSPWQSPQQPSGQPPATPPPVANVDSPLLYPGAPVTLIDAVESGKPVRQATWGLPDAGVMFLLWVTMSIVAAAIAALIGDPEMNTDPSILLAITLPWLGLGGWPWLVARLKGNGAVMDYGLTARGSDIGWGLFYGVLCLVLATITAVVTSAIFGEFTSSAAEVAEGLAPLTLVLFALLIGIGAPIVEELGFRGLLFGALAKRRLSPWLTIGLSSVAFSLFHFEPVRIPLLLGTGLILGIARYHRQSTTVPIIAHMVNNIPAALVLAFGGG